MHDTKEGKLKTSAGIEVLNDIERLKLIGVLVYIPHSKVHSKRYCNLSLRTLIGTKQNTFNMVVYLILHRFYPRFIIMSAS